MEPLILAVAVFCLFCSTWFFADYAARKLAAALREAMRP